MSYTYNKQKKRWYSNGRTIRLGNRILNSNGDYIQLNSDGTVTKVGSISKGLDQNYLDYLKKHNLKINTTLEDNAMKSGLINQNGQWGKNSTDTKTKTKIINNRTYFLAKDGKYRNFETGLTKDQQDKYDLNQKKKYIDKKTNVTSNNNILGKIRNQGVTDGLIDYVGDEIGLSEDQKDLAKLVSTSAYFIPVVGNVLAAGDAVSAAIRGDWGEAASGVAGMFIPQTKALKSLKTVNKLLSNNKISRLDKIKSKLFNKPVLTKGEKFANKIGITPRTTVTTNPFSNKLRIELPFTKKAAEIKVSDKLATPIRNFGKLGGFNWVPQIAIYNTIPSNRDKAEKQYDTLQSQHDLNQAINDYNSGIAFRRLGYDDFHNIYGDKEINQNNYNYLRDQVAKLYNNEQEP